MRMSKVKCFSSLEVSKWLLKHIHHEGVVISDKFILLRRVADNVVFH